MSQFTDISLTTAGSKFLLVLLIFAAFAFSYFIYRRTVPPVSNFLRGVLMTLRAAAVVVVVLLLFKPILSITRQKQEKPVVAVLLDQSASMQLVDQKMDRAQMVRRALDAPLFSDAGEDYDLEYYPFSYQLFDGHAQVPDSLILTDDGTDIRRALEQLKERMAEKYFAAVILLTDGANNLGENPARYAGSYGLPIYPIAIGDSSQQKDVLISNYVTNEIAYAGSQIPVDVYLKSNGFQDQRVAVELIQGARSLDSKAVTLAGNDLEQKVRLTFTPEDEGFFKYEIKLPNLSGELTQINNSKVFYVRVLKSKLKILLLSGGPAADFSFLKRALDTDENIEVTAYVERNRGQFYQGSLPSAGQLEGFDCLILQDFPRLGSSQNALNQVKEVLAKGKPVLVLAGKNIDYTKLSELRDFLPIAGQALAGQERSVYFEILPQGVHHPLLRLAEDEADNSFRWQELPPLFTNLMRVNLHSSAQTLGAVDTERSAGAARQAFPLLVVRASGAKKSAAFLGYGLWRWDLLMWGVGKDNESYRRLIRNTLRWLTTQEDSKLVQITSNKEIYRSGEEVKFIAQVYFEDFQPVDGADVTVQLSGDNSSQELSLTNLGEGRYEGSFQVLEGGDYQFSGTAHQQGRVLGRDSGKFSVEAFSLEYQNTRMNQELLFRIASESGGAYYTAADFSNLKTQLTFPEKYLTLENEWEIWNKLPLLIACILLVSAEWFIRKRKGML